ncbi:hypothetical protein [Hydrogenophaga sp.]|uniref:hypothetical protein n=1 Tax=Hydrogenophaga sp. TaxID=1904254 RepID=UPI003F6EDEA3
MELKTDSSGTVVITSMARDWRSALEGALARAARALVRIWRRTHGHERSGQRAIGLDR